MSDKYNESEIYHGMFAHIIWSTMAQQPSLSSVTQHLHDYICDLALLQSCHVISGRILSDHVQLVVKFSPNTILERLITTLKVETSLCMRSNYTELRNFEWQKSDLCFTIGGSKVKKVINSFNSAGNYSEEIRKIFKHNGVTEDINQFLE